GESFETIRKKQLKEISSEEQKFGTDQKKYYYVQNIAKQLMAKDKGKYAELSALLRLFFVKNAPVGFNTSVENEKGKRKRQVRAFSSQRDRDFTLGIQAANQDRKGTNYHRTPSEDPHFWTKYLREELINFLKEGSESKDEEAVSHTKSAFSSYDVQISSDQLQITDIQGHPYINRQLTAERESSKPLSGHRTLPIGNHQLTVWQNTKSLGHLTTLNQGGIAPNLIQTFEILNILELLKDQKSPEGIETQFQTFTPEEKSTIYAYLQQANNFNVANYKQELLEDRRQLIDSLSKEINRRRPNQIDKVHKKHSRKIDHTLDFQAVRTADKTTQEKFLQYPCLILQPKGTASKRIQTLKDNIIKQIHTDELSFANRGSFGFAAPTIGDVGESVRIWPGLIPTATFKRKMLTALKNGGYINESSETMILDSTEKEITISPLSKALSLSIKRAIDRYYSQSTNATVDENLNELQNWVSDRVLSNLIKAITLIPELNKTNDPEELILMRAIRTLENLNEYDVLQAAIEEALHPEPDKQKRNQELLGQIEEQIKQEYQKYEQEEQGGWTFHTARILASGMAGYRTSLSASGSTRTDSLRLYFETVKLNHALANSTPVPSGDDSSDILKDLIAKMKDLSYNFISAKDLQDKQAQFQWKVDDKNPKIAVYDLTNTTVEEAIDDVKGQDIDFLILFESLSKHFQFGADKTTLGRVMVLH
ncbi:MAG: hypothetical protein WBV73_07725, partial [Phormidium sp.]